MFDKKVILSHPTGNANVRAVAKGLVKLSLLKKFYTCIAIFRTHTLYPLTGYKLLIEFKKRVFSEDLKPLTEIRPLKEIARVVSKKIGTRILVDHEKGVFSIDKIYQDLDNYVSKKIKGSQAVYAYEDGALQTFRNARISGLLCFYDLPIGYWRAMHHFLGKEKDIQPLWASTIETFQDSREKLERKDEELRMADQIFVASSFTKNTLKMFPGKLAPIKVIPYGFPPVAKNRRYTPIKNCPLKLLFVGGLSQRKGISYLFEAVKVLSGKVTLTVVGEKSTESCEALNTELEHHTWIKNLAHEEVLKLMRSHDLLIFPSLFEGFGLVITEAMSQGTPVITTNRTCGPDVICHGKNGWIVEAGSALALVSQIQKIIEEPFLIEKVGKAAMSTAAKRPWECYSRETAKMIQQLLQEEKALC